MDYLNFMARNEKTAWKLFQKAAAEPWNLVVQRRAREQLRGIAMEMLTERNAQKLFPGFRLTGRQVPLEGGHVIDNEITAMLGLRLQHGVEAKGWNKDRWRMALNAWDARQGTQTINEQQAALANQLQHLLEQLADAAKAPRGKPFLVITDKLSGPTKARLLDFLFNHSPGTQVIEVEEARILEETKRLRAAFKLPEDLSGGAP